MRATAASSAAAGRTIVFVDLETTGSDFEKDAITEIGLVEVGPNGVSEWSTLLDPGQPISAFIEQLTGISDAMVAGQPAFAAVAPGLAARLEGKLFVAHNARFDYGFLRSEFKRVGIRFRADVLCTVRLSRVLYPAARKHGLDALIERFALVPKGRHRALADAELLWQFWQHLDAQFGMQKVEQATAPLIKRASVPAAIDDDALEALPAMPGVYVFYDAHGTVLQIGQSNDLKKGVAAALNAEKPKRDTGKIVQDIRRIEHHVTAGEIGAALIGTQLSAALHPAHPRGSRSRRADMHHATYSWYFPHQAPLPLLTSPHERDFGRTDDLFGLFDSRAKAETRLRRLADEYALCLVVLGLEPSSASGQCAAFVRHRCAGACCGDESLDEHTARVRDAMLPLRIEPWPHVGPIAFAERHRSGLTQWHVVDNWHYLGSSEDPRALPHLAASVATPLFDRETYAILRRAFKVNDLDILPLRVERGLALAAPAAAPTSAMPSQTPSADDANASRKSRVKPAHRLDDGLVGSQLLLEFPAS